MWQKMLQVGGGGGSSKVLKGTFKGVGIGVYTSLNCGFKPKYISVYSVGNDSSSYKNVSGISVYNDGEIINSFAEKNSKTGNIIFYRESRYANFEITNDGFKFAQNFSGSIENMDMEFLAIG